MPYNTTKDERELRKLQMAAAKAFFQKKREREMAAMVEPPEPMEETKPAETEKKLFAPRWLEASGDKKSEPKAAESVSSKGVVLEALCKGLSYGDRIAFHIHRERDEKKVTTVGGVVDRFSQGDGARARWESLGTFDGSPIPTGETFYFLATVRRHELQVKSAALAWAGMKIADFIELPNVLFNTNSAVPALDAEGTLLRLLCGAYHFAVAHPDKVCLLFGHTDTSGEPGPNRKLSELRAQAVMALLEADPDLWNQSSARQFQVLDYQRYLATLAAQGWSCDPGPCDNLTGPKTEAGVKSFQAEYNQRYSATLAEDGIIGPMTWKALFRVTQEMLDARWRAESEAPRPTLTYGRQGKGWYGCGESFPIEAAERDNYVSETNRRVEIHFYDKGQEPKIQEPSTPDAVQKPDEVEPYDDKRVQKRPIATDDKGTGDDVPKDCRFALLYDALQNKYLFLEDDELEELLQEMKACDDVAIQLDEARQEKDHEAALKKAAKAEEDAKKFLRGPDGNLKNAMQELILVKRNPAFTIRRKGTGKDARTLVYKRPWSKVKGKWYGPEDKTLAQRMTKALKTTPVSKDFGLNPSIKGELFKGSIEETWPFEAKRVHGKLFDGNDYISVEAEAAFFRFAAGCSLEAGMDLKKRQIKLSGSAQATYSLAEAKITATLDFPSKQGLDLLGLVKQIKDGKKAVKSNRYCYLKYTLGMDGYEFTGASAGASIGLPNIDLSRLVPEASASADAEAFVGVKTGGTLFASVQWARDGASWGKLGELKVFGDVRAGAGAGAGFVLGMIKDKQGKVVFKLKLSASVVVGIGVKVGSGVEMGAEQAIELMGHILISVDYRHVHEFADDAFLFLVKYTLTGIAEVGSGRLTYRVGMHLIENFVDWVKDFKADRRQLTNEKRRLLEGIAHNPELLKISPPETLGLALRALMKEYNEGDEEAILKVLRAADGAHEFKWIVRYASDFPIPEYGTRAYPSQKRALRERGFDAGWEKLVGHGKIGNWNRELDKMKSKYGLY